MIIDLNKYLINKEIIQRWYLDKGGDPRKLISVLASATMVPCIVIAYYIGEIDGWSPEIRHSIDSLTKFYGYTEILNKPANCPI
jgi:hypothetical protein